MTKSKSKIPYLLLILIIVLQLLWTGYSFLYRKDGRHSDEIWSYGLANSYYQPFVYQRAGVHIDDCQMEDIINTEQWITGETFRNYITVQPDQRFAYGSVYSNQTLDHHPPLYYALLHTVCSFFPNQFSFGFGFFLSCIFLILTQIYLFRIGREITHSDWAALLTPLLYSGTIGAMDTFTFIRQYSLLTMLAVMFAFYSMKLLSDYNLKKWLVPVLLTAMCAFMTHYYGIIFVGAFTACLCIYMLAKRKIKKMFAFGFSMLGTLGLYFVLYPAAIKQMLGSNKMMNDNRPFSYFLQFKMFISQIMTKLFNIETPVLVSSGIGTILVVILVGLLVIGAPLCFLFRKETWFIRFRKWAFQKGKDFLHWLANANYIPVFGLVASVAVICVVNKITNLSDMGYFALRYLFVTYPFFCLAGMLAVYTILSKIPKIKKIGGGIAAVGAAACIAVQNVMQPTSDFLFKSYPMDSTVDYAELLKGKNCVCFLEPRDFWLLTCFSDYLYQADNIFIVNLQNAEENLKQIQERGISIDYVLTSYAELSDEQLDLLDEWHQEETDNTANEIFEHAFHADEFTSAKIENKEKEPIHIAMDVIDALNDDAGFDLIAELNIINGYMYLLEMH